MDENVLYYGDNLDILRRYIKDETVDLVYLDPPFNSNQNYNVLFQEKNGSSSAAQVQAFEDMWHWDQQAAGAFQDVITRGGRTAEAIVAFERLLGHNDMLAYLSMMAPRLIELYRVLAPTGSLYLHCDITASHYLKVLMDSVFSPEQFRNEIIWHYFNKFQRGNIPMFACGHDTIFFYTKSKGNKHTFKSIFEKRDAPVQQLKRKWDGKTGRIVNVKDKNGHVVYRTVTERKIDDVWRLPYIVPASKEGLGYPTQKPQTLLERIINASSEEGDVILDPFCGCGTTIAAAQSLNRKWIGIDITHLSISLIRHRLYSMFGPDVEFRVIGEPTSFQDAKELATQDPYQFQFWALGLLGARPLEQKKGADKGVDGKLFFFRDRTMKGKPESIVFSVKAGHVTSSHIRDLEAVVNREKAAIGVYISLNPPSSQMRSEAASAGFYISGELDNKRYPKIQLLTIEEILNGQRIDCPPFAVGGGNVSIKRAPRMKAKIKTKAKHLDLSKLNEEE